MSVQSAVPLTASATAIDWSDLVVAGIGLGGVLIGGLLQIGATEIAARRQRKEKAQAQARTTGLSALALAQHLESYILDLNDVIFSWFAVEWYEPYQYRSHTGDEPVYMQPLPDWPERVDWLQLPLATAVNCSNFQRETQLRRIQLTGASAFNDGQEQHLENADVAAQLILKAAELAQSVRVAHNLGPLKHPDDGDFTATAKQHIDDQKRIHALRAATNAVPSTP